MGSRHTGVPSRPLARTSGGSTHSLPRSVAPTSGSRLVGIEGLRAIAIAAVVVTHVFYLNPDSSGEYPDLGPLSAYLLPHLPLGVTLFFALSGFLLYRPFASAIVRGKALPSRRKYLRNRALRILPAYWTMLILAALVFGVAVDRESSSSSEIGRILDPLTLLAAAALIQNYIPDTVLTGIAGTWSLAVEAAFYLSLPLLALLAAKVAARGSGRHHRRLSAFVPVLLLVAVGLSGKAAALIVPATASGTHAYGADWHSVIEWIFWSNADLFSFGMAVAVLRVDFEDGLLRLPTWWPRAALTIAGLIAVSAGIFLESGIPSAVMAHVSNYGYDTLMAAAFGLFLATVVLSPNRGHRRPRIVSFLETRPMVATGLVSYSLFLCHVPVVLSLRSHVPHLSGVPGFILNLTMVGVIAGLIAALSYRYVELPALRRKFPGQRDATAGNAEPMPASQAQAAP